MTAGLAVMVPLAIRRLDIHHLCDICGKKRSSGNHRKCSKKRQAEYFRALAAYKLAKAAK